MTFRPAGKDVTMDRQISYGMTSLGRKVISDKVKDEQTTPAGRIPRVARLMALAIHFETLIADGIVKDHTEIAGLGYVSRSGMTQIMKLQPVTPGIQEAILDLPPVKQGSHPIKERDFRTGTAQE